ncbi:MAG: amidinotransferase [Synergistales bacterium]|nr:amidinotransferase [Synergistales bacterium]
MASLQNSPQYYHRVLERIPPKARPAFSEEEMQRRVWGRRWGVRNDVGTLKTVLLHRPGEEIDVMQRGGRYDPEIEAIIDEDEQWYFRSDKAPDLQKMQAEHDSFVEVLRQNDVEVVFMEGGPRDPNCMFTRDMGMVVDGGVIISRMGPVGKPYGTGRRGEELYLLRKVAELGMPVYRTIAGEGLMEGGSFCLLDETHAAIGMSFRGNASGADQVEEVLNLLGIELIRVPLPGYAMHIDGGIVMVDHDKAIVNVERLPYWFLDRLGELGIEMIFADYRDVGYAVNVLTIRPGVVIMDERGTWSREILEKRGVTVLPVCWEECTKHGGGVHCSSLPLVREKG